MRELGKAVVWFKDVTKNDIPLVGGKGANLGEMTGAGIPVPQGFIVTADAYFYFIENAGIDGVIADKLEGLDIHNSLRLQKVADEIQEIIRTADIPAVIADEIEKAYKEMGRGLVAVRSSATAEDLPEASFAGQQATFLNILGDKNVVNAVRDCWASLFGARAIFYRHEQGFEHFKVGIAVPVQHMVQSEASGVMFTVDPMNGNRDVIVIEAVIGLGEMIVSGDVTPDHYAVKK
ncbi:MAG: phosphoenolpyruvate synthase, partial [Dehalococcoidales bacterium]|nr:phosphoenolpyruvate synthase [Dehalococcoidales bacterium]